MKRIYLFFSLIFISGCSVAPNMRQLTHDVWLLSGAEENECVVLENIGTQFCPNIVVRIKNKE